VRLKLGDRALCPARAYPSSLLSRVRKQVAWNAVRGVPVRGGADREAF
jgi:hypothetical protein